MQIGELACATGSSGNTCASTKKAACRCELERLGAGCPLDAQLETIA